MRLTRRSILAATPALLLPRKGRAQWWPWFSTGSSTPPPPVVSSGIIYGINSDGTILVGNDGGFDLKYQQFPNPPSSNTGSPLKWDRGYHGTYFSHSGFGTAKGISSDGAVTVGFDFDGVDLFGMAWDTSTLVGTKLNVPSGDSGNVICASSTGALAYGWNHPSGGGSDTAYQWTYPGAVRTALPSGQSGSPGACSADGQKIYGQSKLFHAIGWATPASVPFAFDEIDASFGSAAVGCSSDGSLVCGMSSDSGSLMHAVWWPTGAGNPPTQLSETSGMTTYAQSWATCMSDDGATIGGIVYDGSVYYPCWWVRLTGVLTVLPNVTFGAVGGVVYAISGDGHTVGGCEYGTPATSVPFVRYWSI